MDKATKIQKLNSKREKLVIELKDTFDLARLMPKINKIDEELARL